MVFCFKAVCSKQYHLSQLTELKSAKAKFLESLLEAEDGANGSLPLKGSPRAFLL